MSNLRTKALNAAHEKTKETQEFLKDQYKKDSEKTKKLFIKYFNVKPDRVDGHRAFYENLEFRLDLIDRESFFELLGKCPNCNQDTFSKPIKNLVELGFMLENFKPEWNHKCPKVKKTKHIDPKSPAALIETALDHPHDQSMSFALIAIAKTLEEIRKDISLIGVNIDGYLLSKD